ncbi:NAD-dependent deacetylase sirtuin-5 [Massarina eburnea CBS 473.64]|uniref:NAD-dependent deacetylase sirtuin-5 n=1 Tax=Massarina eburnea CBS 473.64 TaxID=1395130 RepID=A0A6A6RKH9_9PLEO|nr:NAD-dependent deacetylase sirtuin-5 [Massarina eburnea CBS 473.64]
MDNADTSDDYAWSEFADLLEASSRVLCLVGAGLSAPSGLATWRGTNGLWNDINLKELASPTKFQEDPVTVWSFYGERLLKVLEAQPNAAHHALAALAKWHGGWLTINQNVDGLLEQTDHPMSRLLSIHGTLSIVRCTTCDYSINVHKPQDIPFLLSLSNADHETRSVVLSDLLHCPKCANLLRPGVVWFGERLSAGALDNVDKWMLEEHIDLVIAAGTSLEVFPAAEWVSTARAYGASLAIIDAGDDRLVDELNEDDWLFKGDIALILPKILHLLNS